VGAGAFMRTGPREEEEEEEEEMSYLPPQKT
jgi:hypothetical protein